MRKTSGQVGRGSCSERSQSGAQADVELPTPFVAPIVFVTSPDGSWFSAAGQVSDDDPANSSHNTTVMVESAIGGGSSGAGATRLDQPNVMYRTIRLNRKLKLDKAFTKFGDQRCYYGGAFKQVIVSHLAAKFIRCTDFSD